MSDRSERVKRWRENTKKRMIDAFGGKCCVCDYNKTQNALEFHHLNPDEKEFNFGMIMARPKAWDKIVVELRKCICVCSNCHKEIHAGITSIPVDYQKFDEKFATFYDDKRREFYNECPFCGKLKIKSNKYCSHECSSFDREKKDWDSLDLFKLRHCDRLSLTDIGEMIGVSSAAVSKRMKKVGINIYIDEPYFYDI